VNKFFIVGCPRSGTTMVQQALNRHSQVVIPPETKFFFSFLGHSRKGQACHVRRLNTDLGIDLPTPKARVHATDEGRAFYEDMARRYVGRLGKEGVTCFGEKTPEHTGHLPRIRQLFPDAKVLVLVRDGRDVALSLSKTPWASPNLYVNFLVWLYYSWVLRQARAEAGSNLCFARYEDVVAAPEKEMSRILQFLELPYESAVTQGWGNREGIPEREYAWKEKALEKITTERVHAFQRELDDRQIAVLERLGRDALPAQGYELLTEGNAPLSLGFLWNLLSALSGFVCRLPWRSLVNELFNRVFSPPATEPAPLPSLQPAWA
jgi:hypothetical protein